MFKLTKIIVFILLLQVSFGTSLRLYGNSPELLSLEVPGFTLKSKPAHYSADNLYEYINGAADLYLNYFFNKLSVFEYRNKQKGSITIDIYEHKDINNGFGIYSSEKPSEGDFLKIGTEGYYEQGILNFFKGKFYVKISSFGIKENEKNILTKVAENFSKQFEKTTGNPEILSAFPIKNKVKNSERYIAKNFLGHSFLHSAFTSDYSENETVYQVFVIETESEKEIKNILNNYKLFLKKKNILLKNENGILHFIDPYYKNKGIMFLKHKNNHLWGLFCKDNKKAAGIINFIENKIK